MKKPEPRDLITRKLRSSIFFLAIAFQLTMPGATLGIASLISLAGSLVQRYYKKTTQVLDGWTYILMYVNCRRGLEFRTGN